MDEIDNIAEENELPKYFDMPDNWQEEMLRQYAEGATNEEIIAWIAKFHVTKRKKFTTNMFYSWSRRIPLFRDIVEIGALYKKAWWLSQGRKNIGDNKFNTPLYIRMMSNLFHWTSEVIESVGDKIDLSKLNEDELQAYRKLRTKMREVKEAASNGVVKTNDEQRKGHTVSEYAGTGRD
jgi:hypothetical protein